MSNKTFVIIALAFLPYSCNTQQKSTLNTKTSKVQQKNKVKTITLIEQSRGNSVSYTLSEKEIIFDKNGKKKIIPITDKDWTMMMKKIKETELNKIGQYPAPTQNRFSDATASSQLIISTDLQQHLSETFDAGIPPLELKEIYQLIKNIVRNASLENSR